MFFFIFISFASQLWDLETQSMGSALFDLFIYLLLTYLLTYLVEPSFLNLENTENLEMKNYLL